MKHWFSIFILSGLLFIQGCDSALTPTVVVEPPTAVSSPVPDEKTPPPATLMPGSTSQPSPTPEPPPSVRIIAFDGNLYIRRGPGAEYNRIGLLKKGDSAQVIGRDVLSKWVQVVIPDTEFTGWVSLLTPFTKIEGDLSQVQSFTFNEWPLPAFIKNCTEHDLIIGPNDLVVYNLYTNSTYHNEVQVDPGAYDIFDVFLPDAPKIQTVDIQEGETIYITVDGSGAEHLCP